MLKSAMQAKPKTKVSKQEVLDSNSLRKGPVNDVMSVPGPEGRKKVQKLERQS